MGQSQSQSQSQSQICKQRELPPIIDLDLDSQIKDALRCEDPDDRKKMCNAIKGDLSTKCIDEYLNELIILEEQEIIRKEPRPNILKEQHNKRYYGCLKQIIPLSVDHRNKIIKQINENCKTEYCDFILSYEDKCYEIKSNDIKKIENPNATDCSTLIKDEQFNKVLTEFKRKSKRKVKKSKRKVRKSKRKSKRKVRKSKRKVSKSKRKVRKSKRKVRKSKRKVRKSR